MTHMNAELGRANRSSEHEPQKLNMQLVVRSLPDHTDGLQDEVRRSAFGKTPTA